jgi:tetratricopeptide (TPR) repeat protein
MNPHVQIVWGSLLALAVACAALPASAADPAEAVRQHALADLKDPAVEKRRQAVMYLAVVARQKDAAVLLDELRDPDIPTAKLAEAALWQLWGRSGNKTVDAIVSQGIAAMNHGMLETSVELFTEAIKRQPTFAEAWNKRATAYYLMGEYKKSLKDCDQVMKRNPYHFGALAGYGQIYLRLSEPRRALIYFDRALAINPNMDEIADMTERIRTKLGESDDRTI